MTFQEQLARDHAMRMERLWPPARAVRLRPVEPEPEPPPAAPILSLANIARISAIVCNVSREEFLSRRRERRIVRARHVFFYLARELTSKSFPEIGYSFGFNHTTVLHGVRRVDSNLDKYADTISAAKKLLGVE